MKRKDETPHLIINSEEEKQKTRKNEYQKYYESLLQTRPPENLQEEKIKQEINTKFQKIVAAELKVERKK